MLKVDDRWVSGVEEVKEEATRHFSGQFKEERGIRPTLDGIHFNKISELEAELLTASFTMEEVKEAVWSYEGDKSPGPDGFNFTFIKTCWETIKEEILELMAQFHSNGRLPKAFTSHSWH